MRRPRLHLRRDASHLERRANACVAGALVALGLVLFYAGLNTLVRPRAEDLTPPLPAMSAPVVMPVGLDIPGLDVSVAVRPVGLTAEQHLQPPAFGESGWFQFGPRPGEPGYAVIAAHIDSREGPDAFHKVHTLRVGDAVNVRMSTGALVAFTVDKVEQHQKHALADSTIWQSSGPPRLALVTCAGKFNEKLHSYPDNTMVFATAA